MGVLCVREWEVEEQVERRRGHGIQGVMARIEGHLKGGIET